MIYSLSKHSNLSRKYIEDQLQKLQEKTWKVSKKLALNPKLTENDMKSLIEHEKDKTHPILKELLERDDLPSAILNMLAEHENKTVSKKAKSKLKNVMK